MRENPSQLLTQRGVFRDFDAFSEAGRDWRLRFRQLDRGGFIGELEQVIAGPVVVSRCRFNRRIEQLGVAPPGCWTFGVPECDLTPFRWRRHEVAAGDVLGFRDGVEMDSVSEPGFHLFAITITEPLLETAARRLEFGDPGEVLKPEHVARFAGGNLAELRRLCRRAVTFSPAGPDANRALVCDLSARLPGLMLEGFSAGACRLPVATPRSRRRALRRAREVIREAGEPIHTVAELCELTGENERTLRYAFQEAIGVSPKAYLQIRRLNAVRRDLLDGGPDTLIADIANRQSFWHMGQFAADYRKMFGELPSETLRRRGDR